MKYFPRLVVIPAKVQLFSLCLVAALFSAAASGAQLTGALGTSPANANLTTEGSDDWAHWGLVNTSSFNRKNITTPQISNYTLLGSEGPYRYDTNSTAFSWSSGTPTATATNSTTGLFFRNIGNGYQLTVSAGTTPKRLRLYVGLWRARGKLTATLSDSSAPAYVTVLDNPTDKTAAQITLDYSAASNGQTLTIQYTVEDNYSNVWGNITLQAATLSNISVAPLSGSVGAGQATANLAAEGTTDWAHWGLVTSSSFNRKNIGSPQISNYTLLGAEGPYRYDSNDTAFSWSSGTPTASATNTPTGLFFRNIGNGYQLTVPAGIARKRLKLYVGLWRARGKFTATLSDNSSPAYVTVLDNPTDKTTVPVTLEYSAASNGQTLTIRYTLEDNYSNVWGNITLQAATLADIPTGANNPPTLSAIGNRTGVEGDKINFPVTASDPDGTIPVLTATGLPGGATFVDNNNGTGTFNWNTAVKGTYTGIKFTATDKTDSTLKVSETITLTISAAGVQLTGTVGTSQSTANLSTEGAADWAHWGLVNASSLNRKSAVTPQISNYTLLGAEGPYRFDTNSTAFSWSSGTPTATTTNSPTGIFFRGIGNGYQLTVPAGVTRKRLKLYVGLWRARGKLTATLSDNSVPAYVTVLDNSTDKTTVPITLDYSAATNGQTLTITYTLENNYGNVWGNITLQAATLSDIPVAPSLPIADDFNDGNANGWSVVDDSGVLSSWNVMTGEYHQLNRVESKPGAFVQSYHKGTYAYLGSTLSMTDYRFSVDATYLSSGVSDDIGVLFRYQNNNNYYRVSMNTRYGYTRLEKKIGGAFFPIATNARGYLRGQLLNFTIEVKGSLILVWINGDPLFSVKDTSLSSGAVGVYTQDNAKFDNVTVTAPSTAPRVVLSRPLAYSVDTDGTLDVEAYVLNAPAGGWVEFLLDGASPRIDSTAPYFTQYTGVLQGEHTITAILRHPDHEADRDTNVLVGASGNYYVSMGDSITNGSVDTFESDNKTVNGRIIGSQGYTAPLAELLDVRTGKPTIVFNEGIGGDDSYDAAVDRIASILQRHPNVKQILVLLGANDAFATIPSGLGCAGSACNGTYKGNMQTLINKIIWANYPTNTISSGITVMVGLPSPIFDSPAPLNSSINLRIKNYHQVIKTELTGISLTNPDFYTPFLTSSVNHADLMHDIVHPNALGHLLLTRIWHNALNPASPLAMPFVLNNLTPSDYKQNLIENKNKYYKDQSFTITNALPAVLNNGRWVMTADADRNNSTSNYLSFTVDRNVNVYIAYDGGASSLPNWLTTSFTATGQQISTSNPNAPIMKLYKASYTSGTTVTLGGNLAAGAIGADANYVAIVVEN